MMNPITLFRNFVAKVREINKKYATPKVKLSRPTRIALLGLRLYLIILVILLAYKFFTIA
jgi:hypothetical protein